jgi:hypothetical protein
LVGVIRKGEKMQRQRLKILMLVLMMFGAFPILLATQESSAAAQRLERNVLTPITAAPHAPVASSLNITSPLGTNVWFFRDWVSEWSMVDAFKQSRAWIPQCMDVCAPTIWDTGESALLDLDANGWVRSIPAPSDPPTYTSVATTMFGGAGSHYPAGQYIVLYDGEGTIVYGNDAIKNNALSTPGRDVLTVTPNVGILLRLTATDPNHTNNYLRNIRVIVPGFESNYATQVFHPTFLSKIEKYRVLRFMQWMNTNGSTQTSWAARALPQHARWTTQSGSGVPIEIMVALANRVSADPWFTLPHQADDSYITQFATLVRDSIAPGLSVYVEYSNEVWNGAPGFNQSLWVQAQGAAKWSASPASAYTKQINWYGMRSAQMCDIWKAVWGAQSNRVICVMGAQSGNAWTASQALDCPLWTDAGGAPCYQHGINVVAIGPYFAGYFANNTFAPQVAAWTSDPDGGLGKFFTEVITGGLLVGSPASALQRVNTEVDGHVAIANARGLSVVAYEAGAHLDPLGNATLATLFQNASRDPRMGEVYDRYLANWRAHGRQMFTHYFNVGNCFSSGCFGALEYMDETSRPKYDALMRFMNDNACWWQNCSVSASVLFFLPMVTH